MLDNQNRACIAVTAGGGDVCLLPQMANRHGLIAGATGTGKTCTLQNMAETFSRMGVPVFATDIKGDLSGVARPGGGNAALQRSVDTHHLAERGFAYAASPVCLWDIFGEAGHPLRTTISEMGPLLLSQLLDLNDIQSNVLSIIRQSKSTRFPIKKYKNGACFSRPVFCLPFTPRKGVFSPLLIIYFTSWKVVE